MTVFCAVPINQNRVETMTIYDAINDGILDRKMMRDTSSYAREWYGVGYLLGSSTKIDASNNAGEGYLSYIQYLSPASGYSRATHERKPSLCPFATKGCEAACLGVSAGRMRFTSVQRAQVKRTALYHKERDAYFACLAHEILRAKRKAEREGLRLSVRLNGTSDIIWENIPVDIMGVRFRNIFLAFPDVIFYDYTKIPLDYRRRALSTPNYHLTYSYTGETESLTRARDYLREGVGVSVVYTGNPDRAADAILPSVKSRVDGDVHDMRFLDPAGSIVLLKAKGDAKRDRSGFVVRG